MVPFLDGVRKAKMTEQFHWTTLHCFGIDFKKRGKEADLSMRTEKNNQKRERGVLFFLFFFSLSS